MDTHWKFLQTSLENKIGPNCIGIRSQINSQYFALVNQGIKKKNLVRLIPITSRIWKWRKEIFRGMRFKFGFRRTWKKIYFISVNLRFLQSATATLLLAALNSLQKTGAAAKPEAKPPMGRGRGRVGEKGKASGRGSERQKGGRPWEKTWKIRTGAQSTRESQGNDSWN